MSYDLEILGKIENGQYICNWKSDLKNMYNMNLQINGERLAVL
uniref:Uncharacterized protein n=1 Tax=Siphoviridae sp. ctwQY3 TaxID=2826515 RepID=A0A8S5LU92_9CAUD|nr:MAG TPA: hypothetical protein [Siphoviridae sp. ctwQY3]